MNPVRVAFDRRLGAYRPGGIARYARELELALRRDAECRIVPVYSRRDSARPPGGVVTFTPPHHRWERLALGLELLVAACRWDVFHATDVVPPFLPGRPTVATLHDLAFLRHSEELTPQAQRYYGQIASLAGRVDRWIVPSQWTAGDATSLIGIETKRIAVVPHGVPEFLQGITPLEREEREPFLLAVGTVEPRKRYNLLLDAIERVATPVRAVIVGRPGWNTDKLQDRLASSPLIEWLPNTTDRALRTLYQRALAVVVPSRAEGFGFSALESMACGTPVISSGGGALPEVTGSAALTVSDADPDVWAAEIDRLRADKSLWQELSQAGYRQARHFTWQRAAKQTLAVYRDAVDRRN